jgi:hypothetical protein
LIIFGNLFPEKINLLNSKDMKKRTPPKVSSDLLPLVVVPRWGLLWNNTHVLSSRICRKEARERKKLDMTI